MKAVAWVLIALYVFNVVGLVLDRTCLWMEDKGWIYYRRTQGSGPGSWGNAMLEVHRIFEPNKGALVEAIKEVRQEVDDSGTPPDPVLKRIRFGDEERT